MLILVDLNLILDVLLDRAPHADAAAELWALIEGGQAQGALSAHAVTTLHYLAARGRGAAFAERCVREVLSVFRVAPVDGAVLNAALSLGFDDFEDAVCAAAALAAGCQLIASRDLSGFRGGPLPVLDARGAAAAIRARRG